MGSVVKEAASCCLGRFKRVLEKGEGLEMLLLVRLNSEFLIVCLFSECSVMQNMDSEM